MTASDGTSPKKSAESKTEKNGSLALMVCVKETATFPSDTFVSKFPTAWITANGAIGFSIAIETCGGFFAPLAHIAAMSALPTPSSISVTVTGYGNVFKICLL